ncbi:MAG: MFS transporter [Aquincola sp.]|nr:MFS transporter [Aquincola sp.]
MNPAPSQVGEFHRGWRIVLLALAGAATTMSVTMLYGFGAMVLPLEKTFGWSRGDMQAAISFLSLGVIVASQFAGWFNLRWGLRRVTLVSLVATPLALFMLCFLGGSVWSLYLGYFLVPLAGVGITFVTWTQLVSQWFDKRRGFALAIVLCGSGLSAAVMPALLTWAIDRWDVRAGWIVMGLMPLLLALPLAWLFMIPAPGVTTATAHVRPSAAATGPSAGFRLTLRSRKFWVLNVALTLVVSAVVGMVTNTVPLLRDLGHSAAEAGAIFGSFGLSLVAGRLLAGYLIDRLWAPGVAAATLFMPAVGCLLLWTADAGTPVPLLIAAVCLTGIGAGAEFDLSAYLVARYFGLADYGRLFGVHLGLITFGGTVAPLMYAWMYKSSGNYNAMLAYCVGCCIVGPLLLLTLGRQPASSGGPSGHPTEAGLPA